MLSVSSTLVLKVGAGLVVVCGLVVAAAWIYFTLFFEEPEYIADVQAVRPDVLVQPARALELAAPYLEAATEVRAGVRATSTHVVLYRDHYHVRRSDYPAKSPAYYLRGAVRVHVDTGIVTPPELVPSRAAQ